MTACWVCAHAFFFWSSFLGLSRIFVGIYATSGKASLADKKIGENSYAILNYACTDYVTLSFLDGLRDGLTNGIMPSACQAMLTFSRRVWDNGASPSILLFMCRCSWPPLLRGLSLRTDGTGPRPSKKRRSILLWLQKITRLLPKDISGQSLAR